MDFVTLGPLVFAAERLAAILGIGAFLAAASALAARLDERRGRRLGSWAAMAVLAGLVAARLGHVLEHLDSFLPEPLRILAFWQGGFAVLWSIPAVLLVTLLRLRDRRLLAWAALPLAAGLLAGNTTLRLAESTGGGDGKPLPALALAQMEGEPIDLAATQGRPRVLNLWATWCAPCRREMPLLAEVARATPQADFLFVNQGEGRDRVAAYLAREKLALRHVVLDSTSALPRYFGTPGIPVTAFFDGAGRLRNLHLGELSREHLAGYLAGLTR